MHIAFQGVPGAYSHLACQAVFPERPVLACATFEDVFEAVEAGRASLAMLPVENSQAGRVTDIHRLLPERRLTIVGEHYQPVHHQLLAVAGARLPGIRLALSHPQALAQCRKYLRTRAIEVRATTDTAGAAHEVARTGDPTVAAIASAIAGELNGLVALDRDIEDDPSNTTRFLVMAREAVPVPRDAPAITSVLFQVRNLPAALYKALGGFATNGVNLLKIESYQLGGFTWAQFVVDLAGHPEDPSVARALEELRYFSLHMRILGIWAAHPARAAWGEPPAGA